ncbi:MAG: hypothetical protein AB1757_23720 [Acidobacteriota bacterium]
MKHLDEIESEVSELKRSLNASRAHGILYYFLLVVLMLVGFAIGYATHSLVGAAIIGIGLAVVAWREVTHFRARSKILAHVLAEKRAEQRQIEEIHKEFEVK